MTSPVVNPDMPAPGDARAAELTALIAELTATRSALLAASCRLPKTVHDDFRASAFNLLHYLALRQCDLRPLQGRLAELGRLPSAVPNPTYWRPLRRCWSPYTSWLTPDSAPRPAPSQADASLRVPADWLACLDTADSVRVRDARGARRRSRVVDRLAAGCWLEGNKTCYLINGTRLQRFDSAGKPGQTVVIDCIPGRESSIRQASGDLLVLTSDPGTGRQATRDSTGHLLSPAMTGCTLPEVLQYVKPGEEVWFDDGRIGGQVESNRDGQWAIRIRHALPSGSKLRGDKGINFPASDLHLPGLTAKDAEDLAFVSRHADMVALSFANTVEDVRSLKQSLRELGAGRPLVVLKIETVSGFRNLPAILLEAMRNPGCGVMIARGDLALEAGFERLAEVQEEILWLWEAAHVPVIWATQVLENLAKTGAPTRAEITDTGMGHRAECVMLNSSRDCSFRKFICQEVSPGCG